MNTSRTGTGKSAGGYHYSRSSLRRQGRRSRKRKAGDKTCNLTKVAKPKRRTWQYTRRVCFETEPVTKKRKCGDKDRETTDRRLQLASPLESLLTDFTGLDLRGTTHDLTGSKPCQCTRCRSLENEVLIQNWMFGDKDQETTECRVQFTSPFESLLTDFTAIDLRGTTRGLNGYKPKETTGATSKDETLNESLMRFGFTDRQENISRFNSSNLFSPSDEMNWGQWRTGDSMTRGGGSTSIGRNIYRPDPSRTEIRTGLRPIIIDGSNVAFGHSSGACFSVRGLDMCVQFFLDRGHTQVLAFVPLFRRAARFSTDPRRLDEMARQGTVVFTPSRFVGGALQVCYDDRYVVQCAAMLGGVIVSMDNYRDLLKENEAWADTITKRLLMFTWVGDILIFPSDPFGRRGVSLDALLTF